MPPTTPPATRKPTRPMLMQPEDIVPLTAAEASADFDNLARAFEEYDRHIANQQTAHGTTKG